MTVLEKKKSLNTLMANSTKWIVFIEHRKDHDNMLMVLEMLDGYIYMNMQFAATGCYMYSFKNLLLKKYLINNV